MIMEFWLFTREVYNRKYLFVQVKWSGPNGSAYLPLSATEKDGRLEIRGFSRDQVGEYICTAVGFQDLPEAQVFFYSAPTLHTPLIFFIFYSPISFQFRGQLFELKKIKLYVGYNRNETRPGDYESNLKKVGSIPLEPINN